MMLSQSLACGSARTGPKFLIGCMELLQVGVGRKSPLYTLRGVGNKEYQYLLTCSILKLILAVLNWDISLQVCLESFAKVVNLNRKTISKVELNPPPPQKKRKKKVCFKNFVAPMILHTLLYEHDITFFL